MRNADKQYQTKKCEHTYPTTIYNSSTMAPS
jgi:hypothetical protein